MSIKNILINICCVGFTTSALALQPPSEIEEVLTYWFGSTYTAGIYPEQESTKWFGGGPKIDEEILSRFGHLVIRAAKNELDSWKETPRGRLAHIILMDQFPRNIYRGMAEAFAYDQIALQLTLEGLSVKDDLALLPIERIFFYLPLEHSENREIQELSLQKFQDLLPLVPIEQLPFFMSFEDYAKKHYEVIERFGRFPHRNKVLGRESTAEEVLFLKDPYSSF